MINPSTLDALNDDELRSVITQSQALLKRRDEERKAKALNDARALLASVGLSLKHLGGKAKKKAGDAPLYKGGVLYQHPTNKALVWNAKGQKPNWLRELEGQGGKAVEMETVKNNPPTPVKQTG
jgi:hypothetical protein